MLGGRYRVVGLLGRGGMGEVYRADDLTLGQAVALKFLPASVERDQGRLQRFLNEVKIARQISHSNVCRVYDVGEVEGHHYLSMEYVDGEDLASLLRRIGRLPHEKALQVARQICAGVAAAHEQGILHRDLKPANVMIDGRGRVKITDFGLAGLSGSFEGTEVLSGTPAYMSPEQVAGHEVTVRSDLYALGLVLYELFTGKQAFDAGTPAEVVRLQRESAPTSPSSHVEGLDQAVERVILRCLVKDPRQRPASALAVAAALPGGDPLAAALAAGETPSPEMVAEAGEAGGLSPPVALACLGALAVGVALVVALSSRTQLTGVVSPEKPPEVLSERAREILKVLGHTGPAVDSASWFYFDGSHADYLSEHDQTPGRWERLAKSQPPALHFIYRESPRYLVPKDFMFVGGWDPPLEVSGMVWIDLDTRGNLCGYQRVPPQKDESKPPWPEPDWSVLFREAALDPAAFKPVEPAWVPLFYVDRRAAWEGSRPDAPGLSIRIEAASYHGEPAFFTIAWPWDKPGRMEETPQSLQEKISTALFMSLIAMILAGGAWLARRNLRLGRGDRKGAFRLAACLLGASTVVWLLRAHHVPDQSEMTLFFTAFAWNLFMSAALWIVYIALEPYLRRLWPHIIVSWVRLLDGRFRDPLVGRDSLIGMMAGTLLVILFNVYSIGGQWAGFMTASPSSMFDWGSQTGLLRGMRYSIAMLFDVASFALFPLLIMVVLLLLRLLLRRQGLAVAAFLILWFLGASPDLLAGNPWLGCTLFALMATLVLTVLFRVGILALAATYFGLGVLLSFPMTFRLSSWYAMHMLIGLAAFAAAAGWSFYISLAGRPVFKESLLKD
jgi:serine/threonine-protein kinase